MQRLTRGERKANLRESFGAIERHREGGFAFGVRGLERGRGFATLYEGIVAGMRSSTRVGVLDGI
jgi:hypothetical protein